MATNLYDKTLREEFKLIRKLNNHHSMKRILDIYFFDRFTGQKKSVERDPSIINKYPEKYEVVFKMPVYVAPNKKRNWSGKFTFKVTEQILLNRESTERPYATFEPNGTKLFNNHVSGSRICDGTAWSVARNYGLWYYIIAIGMIINQEPFISDNKPHFNEDAFKYWVYRNKKPVSEIDWPFNLNNTGDIIIKSLKKSLTIKKL